MFVALQVLHTTVRYGNPMLRGLGILVYVAFRYEFSFAVGAVVAVLHDVLMSMGFFFISGRELSAPIVAAVLTIIGFSINDTIVIFDRECDGVTSIVLEMVIDEWTGRCRAAGRHAR